MFVADEQYIKICKKIYSPNFNTGFDLNNLLGGSSRNDKLEIWVLMVFIIDKEYYLDGEQTVYVYSSISTTNMFYKRFLYLLPSEINN